MEIDLAPHAGSWLGRQPETLREALIREGRVASLARGQWLHGEGDEQGGLAVVLSGALKLIVTAEDGREAMLDIAGAGSAFGQAPRFGGGPRLVTALAAEPARVLVVSDAALQRIAPVCPEIWQALSALLYRQLARSIRLSSELLTLPPPARLAARLIALARLNRMDPAAWAPVSQSDLAQMTALSRKTVNGLLRRWTRLGLVEVRYGGVRVISPPGLTKAAAP